MELATPAALLLFEKAKTAYACYQNAQKAYDIIMGVPSFEEHVREGFRKLNSELARMEKELAAVVQVAHVHTQYAEHETIIREAFHCFLNYLDHLSEHWKIQFIKQGEPLRNSVRTLLEGLVGERFLGFDIIKTLLENDYNTEGGPGRVKKKLDQIVTLVYIGILLHASYVNLSKMSTKDNASTERLLVEMYDKAFARMESEMEKKEKETVHIKILDIAKNHVPGYTILSDEVHYYLRKNYDYKQWVVIVIASGFLKSFYHFHRPSSRQAVDQSIFGAGGVVGRIECLPNLVGANERSELPYHYATLDGKDPQNSSSTCILAISYPLYFKESPVKHSLPKSYEEKLGILKYEAPGSVVLSWALKPLLPSSSASSSLTSPSLVGLPRCTGGGTIVKTVVQPPSEEQVADELIYDLTVSQPRNVYLAVKKGREMSTDNALGVPWMKEYPRPEIVPRNCPLVKELPLGGEKLLVLAFTHPKGIWNQGEKEQCLVGNLLK